MGLENTGLEPVFYNEIEKRFCETISLNKPEVPLYDCDIRTLTAKKLLKDHCLGKGDLFAIARRSPMPGI